MRATINSTEGFTLLEVMIALAVMATALVALMGLSTGAVTTHERLQRITQATLLAQQKMSEASALAGQRQNEKGAFEDPFEAYRWRIRYSDPPVPVAGVQMVQVSVLWGEEAKNESVELTSFVFQ